ncbi:MIP18 family protein galla-1 [Cyclospora cayetanensis]|uniref:MIP18 family protein galla-1 n=1 Tax=Cyclospora cayetanensis TaxID=88456 RepID=A0A6P6RV48_9EIME|nr:MIP18 family protein galla-1 [Cyclospora cayetanensis]
MGAEGDNPAPHVQRVHDGWPRCTYSVNFYSVLRSQHYQENQLQLPLLTRHQQQHRRAPPPLLPQVRPWLGNRDLRWQQEELHELLLEERELLLQESQLMRPDSILAAYSYEHRAYMRGLPSQAAGKAVSEQGSDATAADGCGARGPCRTSRTRKVTAISHHGAESCGKLHIDSYRAEIFARSELLTAQEVYAAVRCITDPEHPYTLEELLVMVPDYVKVRCSSCNSDVSAASPRGSAASCCCSQQKREQHPSHWRTMRDLRVEICFRPTIPHCSQATLIGLLLLVKAQRAAAAVGATATSSVSVSIIPGAHASYLSINKQLGDKERVRAAAANPSLRQMIDSGLKDTEVWTNVTDLLWCG